MFFASISEKISADTISRTLVGDTLERSQGYCTGMINALLKIDFEELRLHRIRWVCTILIKLHRGVMKDPVCERSGFVKEGFMRDVATGMIPTGACWR